MMLKLDDGYVCEMMLLLLLLLPLMLWDICTIWCGGRNDGTDEKGKKKCMKKSKRCDM